MADRLPLTRDTDGLPEGLPSGDNLSAGGGKVVSVATCTAGTDAANKDYVDSVAGGQLVPDQRIVPGCFNRDGTNQAGYVAIGSLVIDPSKYSPGSATQTFRFCVVLETTSAAITGTIRLVYPNGTVVSASTITCTAAAFTSPETLFSTLTKGSSPNLLSTLQTYTIELLRNGGTTADNVFCRTAEIMIDYS